MKTTLFVFFILAALTLVGCSNESKDAREARHIEEMTPELEKAERGDILVIVTDDSPRNYKVSRKVVHAVFHHRVRYQGINDPEECEAPVRELAKRTDRIIKLNGDFHQYNLASADFVRELSTLSTNR